MPAQASERGYQEHWCEKQGGQVEYVLEDRTRVDCLTDEYAVEVDFGRKWDEAIGQASYYAEMTGRKPGILLILKEGEGRFLRRLLIAIQNDSRAWGVWIIDADALSAR